jgi:tryptophan-rich sensory protein
VIKVKKQWPWKTYAFWILLAEGVGALSGFLSREGTRRYLETVEKPPLSPPGMVFPIVWTVLFALMGIGAARIFLMPPSAGRRRALELFLVQLAVNFFWSILFFNWSAYALSLFWLLLLWGLVLWMLVSFYRLDRPAGLLQIPYLLWISFAAYLNLGVWLLNR